MPERLRRRRSTKKHTTRWIVASVVLCSAMSCVAPVLYASDCSRWIAEYKQGLLQKRAARRLRAAKYRLTTMIHPPAPVHRHPGRRPMGPLEALHRFQIDCGDFDSPPLAPKLPPVEPLAKPLAVAFPPLGPPDLPMPAPAEIAEEVPPLTGVPTTTTAIDGVPSPSPVPEPASGLLVLSGVAMAIAARRSRVPDRAAS